MKQQNETRKYAFFSHRACEFFPCHADADPENFNCLFCYCPLYALGARCGGNFSILPDGTKDCSACLYPHRRENYDAVIGRYGEIAALCKQELGAKAAPEPHEVKDATRQG